MIRKLALLSALAIVWSGTQSCAPVAQEDVAQLNKTAMTFNHAGAELGECGLVSQFERGRSASSQSAGGG